MKGKYEVHEYVGMPLTTDNSGRYQLKRDANEGVQAHSWRTGKHTRGKFTQPGQILITENNLKVVIVAELPLAFKDRHDYTPLQRFTSEVVSDEVVEQAVAIWQRGK